MLAEHPSQRDWLRQHHGIDEYLEMMERWTRANGQRARASNWPKDSAATRDIPTRKSPLLNEWLGVRPWCAGVNLYRSLPYVAHDRHHDIP